MLNLYATPENLPLPKWEDFRNESGRSDWAAYAEAEAAWVEKVREWAISCGTHPLAGEIVRTPQGDGTANYMIAKINGRVSLIPLPTGDAWRDDRFERLATVAELKRMVDSEKRMNALFGRTARVAG